MLSEPPGADPHAGWCGRGQGKPGLYPILWEPGGAIPPGDPTRGIAITPADGRARVLAVETNRPVEAVLAAQLKPDGSRSRLLSRRSRASTDAAVHRHAVPRTDVTVVDQRQPLRLANGRLVAGSSGRCRNSVVRSRTDSRGGRSSCSSCVSGTRTAGAS